MENDSDLHPFDFKGFLIQFGMPWRYAQQVFAVSRRTVAYWSKQGLISGPAHQLARTIARDARPWTHSGVRGWSVVCDQMTHEWRQDVFGALASDGDYRTWRYRESPEARARTQAHAARCAQVAAADAERKAAARRLAITHRRRRRARPAPPGATMRIFSPAVARL